jgi:tetratricopeptide (TPR) repeat protein
LRATRREEPSPLSVSIPRFLAGHEILGEIGRGGMGIVYKARQLALSRIVALKFIPHTNAHREDLARFWAEAEAVAQLSHPHIVPIYDLGEHDGLPFYTMEFLPDGNLEQLLEHGPLTPLHAATLLEQVAQAVQHAHEQGILHRDLKPANVLLHPAKIADFGLARRLDGTGHHTRTGAILGTPAYMAPEQAVGRREQGPGVDIWSLGVMLYECLTGRLPFQGSSVLHTLELVRREDPVAPSRIDARIPRDLENIVLRCLEKDPARRYPSAAALAEDLQRWLAGEPVRARPIGPWTITQKWARRRPALASLIGCVAALMLVIAAAIPYHMARLEARAQSASAAALAAHEKARQADLRATLQREMLQAREAVTTKQFAQAAQIFHGIAQRVEDEDGPELLALRDEARRHYHEARKLAEALPHDARLKQQIAVFLRHRQDAIFLSYAGLLIDPSLNNPTQARQELLAALKEFPQTQNLSEAERWRLQQARAELCFILADLDGRASPREGLRWLDGLTGLRGVHLRRARYLESLGQREAAALEREAANKCSEATALDDFLSAQEAYTRGKYEHALKELETALDREPDLFWAHLLHAAVQMRRGQPTEALVSLGWCIHRRPGEVWPYLLRAGVRLGQKQPAQAREDLDRVASLELNPAATYTHLVYRGVLALAERRPDEAIAPLEQAIRLFPQHPAAHANLAEVYWKKGHRPQALERLGRAIETSAEASVLYRKRATWHSLMGHPADALRDMEAIAHPSVEDWAERARLLYTLRRYPDALSACTRALRGKPEQRTALRVRAESLLELGKHREAWIAFNRFLGQYRDADAFARRARARAACNDFAGVIEDYTQALALRDDPVFRCARGWAYLIHHAPELALSDFQRAVAQLPTEAHIGRATAKMSLGQTKEALADVELALQKPPTQHRLLYAAARVLARCSPQPTQALKWLDAALESLPAGQRSAFWRERVAPDPALVPLAKLAGFHKLQAKYAR